MLRSVLLALAILGPWTPSVAAAVPPPEPQMLQGAWEFALDGADRGLAEGWAAAAGTAQWTPVVVPHVTESRAATVPLPEPQMLQGAWEFALDGADRGLAEGWAAGAGTAQWTAVVVPHVTESRPLEPYFAGTIAWYRITFTAPPADDRVRWALRFEQVRRTARVWLNGVEIGGTTEPYAPLEIDAAGLRHGETNQLVVRVDGRLPSPTVREGWWNWSGLVRPVWLMPRGAAVSLRELGLLPRVTCAARCRADVMVKGRLVNHRDQPVAPEVEVTLESPDGSVTRGGLAPRTLAPGVATELTDAIAVPRPVLWWPDRPRLYAATVRLRLGGEIVEEQRLRVGLRRVEVRSGRLLLNGRVLKLRGASIEEDAPGRGPALTPSDIDWIAGELKAVGANVTRANYPHSERLLSRLDELGILVWSQAPVYHRDDLLRTPAQRAAAVGTVREAVLATRNHPSVITHSVANELASTADRRPGTAAFLRDARRLTRRLDPTRPVAVDLMGRPGIRRQRAYAGFDLLGANCYFGWYRARRGRPTASLSSLAPYLRELHRQYPRQAIVLTEFGAESMRRGPASEKGTFAFQSRYVRRVLDIADRLRFLSGAIYWTLREFAVKPRWNGGEPARGARDGIHNKGLVTYDGRRKPAWHVARALFRRVPMYRGRRAPRAGIPGDAARARLRDQVGDHLGGPPGAARGDGAGVRGVPDELLLDRLGDLLWARRVDVHPPPRAVAGGAVCHVVVLLEVPAQREEQERPARGCELPPRAAG